MEEWFPSQLHPTHPCLQLFLPFLPKLPFFPLLSGNGCSEILPWAKHRSGNYFRAETMRKICFPTFHQGKDGGTSDGIVLSPIGFFLASFEQNFSFQGEVSSTNPAQPSLCAPIKFCSNSNHPKTKKQRGKWFHTFLPKLQLINIHDKTFCKHLWVFVGSKELHSFLPRHRSLPCLLLQKAI